MNEPTEVEIRVSVEGKITVLSFTWKGRKLPVVSEGRRRETATGFRVLVMTTRERVYELDYDAPSGIWRIVRASEERLSA
ncbi:MAG: hypothetical protein ACRDH2_03475 [Anaerolineales bacterium]